jgi:hypothetical protein
LHDVKGKPFPPSLFLVFLGRLPATILMIQKKHTDFLLKKMATLSDSLSKLKGMLGNDGNNSEMIMEEANSTINSYFGKDLTLLDSIQLATWFKSSEHDTQELIHLADIMDVMLIAEGSPETREKWEQLRKFIIEERQTFPFHWA